MATIPRTYLTTSKSGVSSIPLVNGQVISVWDSDEVWYDAPANGQPDGVPVRRKISGVRVINALPSTTDVMSGILYVYMPNDQSLWDLRVWADNTWQIVGTNSGDTKVTNELSNTKFYITGSASASDTTGTLLKNTQAYIQNGLIYGELVGNASTATTASTATSADSATSAVYDTPDSGSSINPQKINSYLHAVSGTSPDHTGTTLTFVKGDGTEVDVPIQDTVYNVYTQSASNGGIVPGTNTTVLSDSTNLLLTGSGWMNKNNIPLPSSESAAKDSDGNIITDTYYANASWNASNRQLTLSKASGSVSPTVLTISDTTYAPFNQNISVPGLVPANSGATDRFLKGDGTWAALSVANYQGATQSSAGVAGSVPPASAGQQNYYLKGDGTWGSVFSQGNDGLVPGPTAADTGKFLSVNSSGVGVWVTDTDTLNTAGSTNSNSKLFLIGATAQQSNIVTNSNSKAYVTNGKLYSNNIEVVNLSDSQAITNKTYNGYVLDSACAAVKTSSVTIQDVTIVDDFTGDGTTTDFTLLNVAESITSVTINDVVTTAYTYDDTNNEIQFTTAPADGDAIVVTYLAPDPDYDADGVPTNNAVINYSNARISDVLQQVSGKVDNTVVADMYDSTATYDLGDYCMHTEYSSGGASTKLYECTTAITVAEDWDDTHWTEKLITELSGGSTVAALNDLTDVTITSATNGQILRYNGSVWVNGTDSSFITFDGTTTRVDNPSSVSLTLSVNGSLVFTKSYTTSGAWGAFDKVTDTFTYNEVTFKISVQGFRANQNEVMLAVYINDTYYGVVCPVQDSSYASTVNFTMSVRDIPILDDLKNVDIHSVADNDLLIYSGTINEWVNVNRPYGTDTCLLTATKATDSTSLTITVTSADSVTTYFTTTITMDSIWGDFDLVSKTFAVDGILNTLTAQGTGIVGSDSSQVWLHITLNSSTYDTGNGVRNPTFPLNYSTSSTIKVGVETAAGDISYDNTTSGLTATDVQGAIDEVYGTWLTGTLTAGSTTLTLSSNSITANSMFDFYTSVMGVSPLTATVDTTATPPTLTLTFMAQASDISVKVKVF